MDMQNVNGVLQQIGEALQGERTMEAFDLGRRAVARFPQDPEVRAAYGDVLWCMDDLEGARRAYEEAVRLAPDAAPFQADVARVCFALAAFDAARVAAEGAQDLEDTPEAMEVLCRLAEREGDVTKADEWARRAQALDPQECSMPYRIDGEEFRRLVVEAMNEIPEPFREALEEEVAILLEPVPSEELLFSEEPPLDPGLLGLYVGVPRPQREESQRSATLPDRIYLFQHNLEHEATHRDDLVQQIRITLFHEVGHYFGFSDEELEARDFG
jgi:predicted Zn-dependent protease with MMP-like domain